MNQTETVVETKVEEMLPEEAGGSVRGAGDVRVHPLAKLFPPLPDEEFTGLKEDIARHGVREPVKIYDGQVLDGAHRVRACMELRAESGQVVTYPTSDVTGTPMDIVRSLNLHRRHLRPDQRAALLEVLVREDETGRRGARRGEGGRGHRPAGQPQAGPVQGIT